MSTHTNRWYINTNYVQLLVPLERGTGNIGEKVGRTPMENIGAAKADTRTRAYSSSWCFNQI